MTVIYGRGAPLSITPAGTYFLDIIYKFCYNRAMAINLLTTPGPPAHDPTPPPLSESADSAADKASETFREWLKLHETHYHARPSLAPPRPELLKNLLQETRVKIKSEGNSHLLWSEDVPLQDWRSASLTKGKDRPADQQLQEVPREIYVMASLTELEISYTQVSSLPREIGDLSLLQKLHLRYNPRLTELPDTICSLSFLKDLNIYQIPLTALPEKFGSLTSLYIFSMLFTQVNELPRTFCDLPRLYKLHIQGTPIQKLPEDLNERMPSLQLLIFVPPPKQS